MTNCAYMLHSDGDVSVWFARCPVQCEIEAGYMRFCDSARTIGRTLVAERPRKIIVELRRKFPGAKIAARRMGGTRTYQLG